MYAYSKRGSLNGSLAVPGSKSSTIRAVLFGMLADGTTVIHNPLPSKDGLAALKAARDFGAEVVVDDAANTWTVTGLNGKPRVPENVLDTMNSGTTTSFVTGICTLLTDGWAVITGDGQIRRRPWRHETNALTELGAKCIHTRPGCDCPPLVIQGPLHGGVCHLPGFNSQHISGILAPAALLPEGESVDIEVENPLEALYVQLTVDWLKRFGVTVGNTPDYRHYHVDGGQKLTGCDCLVASDWSGVAFPLVAAVCTPSELTITDVEFNDAQGDKAVVDILIRMGADIEKDIAGHRLTVHGGKPLHGLSEIDMNLIPDSLPALSVAAAYAEGDTHFTSLAHVRVKETDRVAVMQEMLSACGADVDITADSMTVHGGKPLHGASVSSHDDHRVAMAMTVCGLFADGEMRIDNAECAAVSFPGFYETLNKAGAGFELKEN
ncbi:MAG: 3-phosphoshikimate 1-carboxyvinyltransferase [Oscillospiraceae bacterium]|nr:3-phosphoshikimate 1-carboxyvinyltransferase [Oscillospiraceae bacterium]